MQSWVVLGISAIIESLGFNVTTTKKEKGFTVQNKFPMAIKTLMWPGIKISDSLYLNVKALNEPDTKSKKKNSTPMLKSLLEPLM